MRLTEMQEELLLCMRGARFPMARFELHNDAEKELVMTALDNVYMEHPEEEMGLVKKRGEALRATTSSIIKVKSTSCSAIRRWKRRARWRGAYSICPSCAKGMRS